MGHGVLQGRVVLVTGAARGIGAQLARRLSEHGATLALVGLEREELAASAAACGPDAGWWHADVTDQEQISAAVDAVRARYGRIDIAVVNAGVATGGTLRQADPVAYDRVIEVNLLGSVRTARAVVPHLIETRGYLLQIASMAAIAPAAVMASYCASKSGVEAFANAVKAELKPHGVDVGVVYLSWIDTDMTRGADAVPALAAARGRMPWPLSITSPLAPAVEAIVAGVLRRSSRIMYPGWLWLFYGVRPLVPTLAAVIGRRHALISEQVVDAEPGGRPGLVGAGGAADAARP